MEPGSDGSGKVNTCALAMLDTGPCRLRQDLLLRALALLPRLEQDAREGLVHVAHAVDGEDVVLLRHGLEHLAELGRRLLQVVEVGGLRRLDDVEQDALVFLRRQLPLRGHVHDDGCRHHRGQHQQRHGPAVERAVQAPLVAPAQAGEHAVEQSLETAGAGVAA